MHHLHPTDLLQLSFEPNWVPKTETSIYEISRCLSQICILILIILKILLLPILKLKFWANLGKITHFTSKILFQVFKRCSFQAWTLFLLILCVKEVSVKLG